MGKWRCSIISHAADGFRKIGCLITDDYSRVTKNQGASVGFGWSPCPLRWRFSPARPAGTAAEAFERSTPRRRAAWATSPASGWRINGARRWFQPSENWDLADEPWKMSHWYRLRTGDTKNLALWWRECDDKAGDLGVSNEWGNVFRLGEPTDIPMI